MNQTQTPVTLDINRWTYKDYMQFASLWRRNEVQKAMRYAIKIVVAWGYDIDLSIDEPEGELPYPELVKLIETIGDTIEKFIAQLDVKGLNTDLNRWKTKDFYRFQNALRELDVDTMSALLIQAHSGFETNGELSFVDGVKLSKAVGERQKELFRKR